MFLVELVMQGIRGFRELVRLRFQSGFNFVAAGNEAGKTTAVETMQRLLFPDSQSGRIETLISRHVPDASRGALVFFSNDGAYYRIIQDFSKRAVNLSKYDADKKDFTLLHKDWENAAMFMAGHTISMSEEDFAKVFVFHRDHYTLPRGVPNPAPTPIAPAQPKRPAVPSASAGRAAADQSRLGELRETLKKAEEAADAEYRAQSAKLALDEVRKKLAVLEEIEQKKHGLVSKLAELKGCEKLPENLAELMEAHERLEGQKATEGEELNSQLNGLKMQLDTLPNTDLLKDKLFIAGGALGVVSFLAGVFVLSSAQQIYLYAGLLLAMGLMGAAWYNGARKSGQRKTLLENIEALEKDRLEIDKRSDKESAAVRACMKSTGAATVGELKDKADSYRYLLSLRSDIEEQRERIVANHSPEMLQQEYNKLQQEALELEKAARAVAQNNIDTYAIRQEIERIEAESSAGTGTPWDFGAEATDLPTDFSPGPAAGSIGQTGFHAELGIASRIGGIEMETLVPAVESAAQRNLAAITNGKYVKIEVGHEGSLPMVHTRENSILQYADMSHGTRDLVYFCLRAGLVEALAGKVRLPVFLDDPLAGFEASRQRAACQVLRGLGAKTQVILFSSNPALKAEGDAAVELK